MLSEGTDRYVILKRGIMMGDPLTKVILHLTNIAARELGRFIGQGLYKEMILDQPVLMSDAYVDTGPIPILIPENRNWDDTRTIVADVPVVTSLRGFPRLLPVRQTPLPVEFVQGKYKTPQAMKKEIIPGVHVLFQSNVEAIDFYFIPKTSRDPAFRGRKFKLLDQDWTGNFDIEDHDLMRQGFRPLPETELLRRHEQTTSPVRTIEPESVPRVTSLWSYIRNWNLGL